MPQKNHENSPKNHEIFLKIMKNHENFPKIMKNHENFKRWAFFQDYHDNNAMLPENTILKQKLHTF